MRVREINVVLENCKSVMQLNSMELVTLVVVLIIKMADVIESDVYRIENVEQVHWERNQLIYKNVV